MQESTPMVFNVCKLENNTFVKNSHNFIKAVLIKRFVPLKKKVLDLGCGRGGDLLKLKFCEPSMYVGVDRSISEIAIAQKRASAVHLRCRNRFRCCDFTRSGWEDLAFYDVVNCQFAIHFAFQSAEMARTTIKRIASVLVDGGLFLGTLPRHPGYHSYEEVCVVLEDDCMCKEYAVDIEDFECICEGQDLQTILIDRFDTFYEVACKHELDLMKKMNAVVAPDANNYVFVMQKRLSTQRA